MVASNFSSTQRHNGISIGLSSQIDEILKQFTCKISSLLKVPVPGYVISADALDDAYCLKLYDDYLNDPDPSKHESILIEDFAKELGVKLV